MSFNEKQRIERYLTKINCAAQQFKNKFLNKKIIYFTPKNKIEMTCSSTNFMHLCGIWYKDFGAQAFYRAALHNKIILDKVWVKKDYSTFEKLQVIDQLDKLISENVSLIHSGRFLYLQYDYAVRTRKKILALTLIDINSIEVPQSLLNLKRVNNLEKGEKILKIEIDDIDRPKL